ncbi:16S rRNA (uracil(1498)-N(3))-methyltransferase [Plectonema radiosum NIES-515]|uniref:Ribosomal RNA small subunit methyltransferase E n=1 Tax=Plectonema radiosum NIES-515 TaxID=2986073 RepID=A0ABT3B100_9CYAN|nr:16S rRNA (uracil(1498)-N(3))-methyltransferase [Plectonema radiosum]MCV3215051.1 16S rRNA (uracil(1498)-N(3))-methyltransferase [Plectonema radiosum NIES-515]
MAQLQRIAIALDQLQQNQIWLTAQQQHYLSRVLRLQKGDRFIAMDGIGKWWLAQLEGKEAQILETLTVETELPISITLMVALPKNGFDEVVRCCTELGVACIAPVMSDRTLLNPSPQKLERWQRIASEAAEQSERSFVPTILEPVSFEAGLSSFATNHKYICEGRGNYPHLKKCLQQTGQTTILIATGPEGGWTEKEIDNAIQAGFQPVSLGRRILRAVTAPIVALSLISACEV